MAATTQGITFKHAENTELDDQAHRRLAEVLRSTEATVILSGYPSALYRELYGDWWRQDLAVSVHSSNSTSVRLARRTEVLWSNRDLSDGQLFSRGGGA